jgi:putative methylase
MTTKRALELDLADLEGFDDPRVDLEQYPTPAGLAANLLHLADLQGDLVGRTVVDLGAGTGILAIGAALRGADRVVGVELDPNALEVARRNAVRASAAGDSAVEVEWIRGDGARLSLCPDEPVTVVMNPPFGAQRGSRHADRAFLETASEFGAVSYSIHNAESHDFVEAFASDEGGVVTHAFAAELDLERRFDFHAEEARTIDVEAFRIEWGRSSNGEGESA